MLILDRKTNKSYITKDEGELALPPYSVNNLLSLFKKDYESGNATISGKTKEEEEQ